MKSDFLLVNGSPSGEAGSTAELLRYAGRRLEAHGSVRLLELSRMPPVAEMEGALRSSSAIMFGTGTYWDSWGSPLQKFFEEMTHTEGTDCWMGKPVAALVTMHSVGGKGVLSRLLGVLNTFGALIPPMCGIVISAVGELALAGGDNDITEDVWRPSDLDVLCHNLAVSCGMRPDWRSWPVEREHFRTKWIHEL